MKFYTVLAAIAIIAIAAIMLRPNSPTSTAATTPQQQLNQLVGKAAPDFTLSDQSNNTFSLKQQRGHDVVLFFSEGVMCYPACWNQIAALGADTQLNSNSVTSANIVTDTPSAWQTAFRKQPALAKGTMLFDSNTAVSNTYGMLNLPSSMHRGMKPGHTFVLIDKNGIVRFVLDDVNMGINDTKLQKDIENM
ncbi:MAG: redoxin domain-containing protein [Candidatus Saccharibacteria bacterium]